MLQTTSRWALSLQLYLTGAVYSLDGSDSLKETMQTGVAAAADGVRVWQRRLWLLPPR